MGFEVWKFFEERGASPMAVDWARPYGEDIEGVWNECDHGELMVALGGVFAAPYDLMLSAIVDCVRSSIVQPCPLQVIDLLSFVEQWTVGIIQQSKVLKPLQSVLDISKDINERKNPREELQAHLVEAAIGIGSAVTRAADLGAGMNAMAHAIVNSAFARATVAKWRGASPMICEHVFNQALAEFAARERHFVPFRMLASSPLRQMSRIVAVRYCGEMMEDYLVGIC